MWQTVREELRPRGLEVVTVALDLDGIPAAGPWIEPEKYMHGLRDWVEHGSNSRYALTPDEVLRRSRPRPLAEAQAAAHFELAQHLYRAGQAHAAVPHFRAAHEMQPDNWTYKRQAWSLADPTQGPTQLYSGDWLSDVQKIGAEHYYAALDMDWLGWRSGSLVVLEFPVSHGETVPVRSGGQSVALP